MSLTPAGLNALLTAPAFVLWFRTSRRAKWEAKGTFPTEAEAVKAMKGSGMWLILPQGKEP